MFEAFRATLVREGKGWYKLYSNQFAIFMGAIAGWAVDNRADVLSYVDMVPQPWRSLLTAVIVAAVPIWLRMKRQPNLTSDIGQK